MSFDFSLLEYSIDMVRLQSEITINDFNEFFRVFSNDSNVSYKEMSSISAYRHNFFVKDLIKVNDEKIDTFLHHDILETIDISKLQECGFWIGVSHNARFGNNKYIDIVLEYNPNKCSGSYYLDYVLRSFFILNDTSTVKKIDFAIDFPVDILDIHLIRDYKANYRVFDNGGSNKTYYMRKRGSDGAFKLYNKQLESGLDSVKTRYEVTLHINNALKYMDSYVSNKILFPGVRITNTCQVGFDSVNLNITGTDKVLLLACMEHPGYLKELSRKKREKIEEFLHSLDSEVSFFDCSIIDNTIQQYFNLLINKK